MQMQDSSLSLQGSYWLNIRFEWVAKDSFVCHTMLQSILCLLLAFEPSACCIKSHFGMMQKQNKAIDKLQQYADAASSQTASAANCSRAEELPSPLECSQRTVIRSLTLQLADVRRQLVHLCSERDQLRDRLRALRGSLGSGRAVEAHTSADIQDLEIFRVDPGQLHVQAQTSAKQGSLDHINGMFVLLDHHVNAVTKAHERLSVLLQCEPPLAQEQSQDGGFQQFGKCEQHMREVKSQVAHAAAMLAAELPAMQATIQVLSAEAIWRQQQGEHQHLKLAGK